jgi:hypothetical protein
MTECDFWWLVLKTPSYNVIIGMGNETFRIFISDSDSHVGYCLNSSGFDVIKIFPPSPPPLVNVCEEMCFFMRGLIRSAWHDASHNILVSCRFETQEYNDVIYNLKEQMFSVDGIIFEIEHA